jgi:DNA-binding CsgD family transcriptional regulator
VLLGRDTEMAAIRSGLALAREGSGFAVALRGEAGIGKTALLDWARGEAAGLRTVAACGAETETHLPFAALLQLVEPILNLRAELPAAQKAALEGALALAPNAPGDRFTVCVAVLGLLRLASREGPLLVVVDDAHWFDAASAECVGFAARRLEGASIAMLVAIRDGEDEAVSLAALESLRLEPLGGKEADDLVRASAGDLAAPVRDAVVAASAGNPLALVEIATSLAPAERSGQAPLPDPLPARGRLAAVFDRRLRALSPEARTALLVAAASESGDTTVLARACEATGVAAAHFDDAEAAGIVAIEGGTLRFCHPLLRSAAWHGADAPSRRATHRALAEVASGSRRAWHLAESVAWPDAAAADALAEAAADASARRGYAEASMAWQRSASLTADEEMKARRLLRACNTSVAAGQMTKALALLDEASAVSSSVTASPRTLHTRCLLLLGTGQVEAAFGFLRFLAEAAAGTTEAATAAMTTADAGMAALLVGEMREVLACGRRATALLGDQGDALVRAQVGACLAAGLVFGGHTEEGRRVLEDVERHVLGVHDQELALRTHSMITHLRVALDDYDVALAHAHRVLESLESISAHAARAAPLGHAADAAHRLGKWDLADQHAREAILIAEETANGDVLPRTLVVRARVAAARGDEALASALLDRASALVEGTGNRTIEVYVLVARGLLALSMGRAEEAVERLAAVGPLIDGPVGLVHPTILPWRPDLVEACAMLGRLGEAAGEAARLEAEARANGGAAGLALAARARGLVEPEDFDPCFVRALELETERPMPFERARTLLLYGTRLHRARRRAEARDRLREAEAIFESLGALPWCERTAAELVAAGAKRRAARRAPVDALTEQERRVAAALARGRTIREVAAQLFLSPKTVDSHLRQVYAKWQIRSRAELALKAAEEGWVDQEPSRRIGPARTE